MLEPTVDGGRSVTSGEVSPPRSTSDAPTETVARPDKGLARGVWEAPAWAFWAVLAIIVVGATLYVLRRAGVLRLKKPEEKKEGPR